MADVFVSYKAEDRRRVQPLVQALQADGLTVWWDEHIGIGDEWRETIELQLDEAKCVVVIWSKRSVGPEGRFVREEASRAQRRRAYVPVLIDAVEPPLGFGESQATSLRGWHGDASDPHYEAVLSAVRRITGTKARARSAAPVSGPAISRRTALTGGTAAAVAVAGAGAWAFLKPGSATAAGDSVAVLPFENLSGNPAQAYFSDGIAEEIRSALARIAGLKVVGRTSSEAVRNDDAATAAKKLGVANILTGSVRQSPSTIRVDAELIDGRSGIDRWSQGYDRSPGDAIKIQTDIAENVASALSAALGHAARAAVALGGTSNAAAQDLYLQADPGRSNGSPEGIERSIAKLDAAIQLDPNYAQAFARKAAALSTYGGTYPRSLPEVRSFFDEATTSAKQAIRLAPNLPEGHAGLAYIHRNKLSLRNADREIQIAVDLPGADATTWANYAGFLVEKGREAEALNAVSRATQLDPLNAIVFANKAWTLFALHRFAPSISAAQEALEIDPSRSNARRFIGYALIMMHRFDEAEAQFSQLPEDNVQARAGRAMIAAFKGNRKASDQLIAEMREASGDTANYQYAQVYAQRKEADAAIHYLDRALAVRDPGLASLRADPFFDPIRNDPRFVEIIRKLDFPA